MFSIKLRSFLQKNKIMFYYSTMHYIARPIELRPVAWAGRDDYGKTNHFFTQLTELYDYKVFAFDH